MLELNIFGWHKLIKLTEASSFLQLWDDKACWSCSLQTFHEKINFQFYQLATGLVILDG
jgi:hypothetical protein